VTPWIHFLVKNAYDLQGIAAQPIENDVLARGKRPTAAPDIGTSDSRMWIMPEHEDRIVQRVHVADRLRGAPH
jgi:hypothetical protein